MMTYRVNTNAFFRSILTQKVNRKWRIVIGIVEKVASEDNSFETEKWEIKKN